MSSISNAKLTEIAHPVQALAPVLNATSTTPRWVSMKGYNRCSVIIEVANGTTVTGAAIGLAQATAVAGTGTKTLAFSAVDAVLDTANNTTGDMFVTTAVVSNTFTTNTTNSKNLLYVIEVPAATLDVTNSFDCMQVTVGNAVNTTIGVQYILRDARYPDTAANAVVSITD